MVDKQRWPTMRYRRANEPKGGPEALQRALSELGSLDFVHRDDLQGLCSCKACVTKNIMEMATEFNTRKSLIEDAPRKKLVAERLTRALNASSELAQALTALDDYSRGYLGRLTDLDKILPIVSAYNASAANKLPTPETETELASNGQWVARLQALERYLSLRLHQFAGSEEGDLVDRGGNTNVMRDQLGSPARYIVRHAWIIFENCRPGVATASENGPFLRFVNCVYEYASGSVEENSTLHNWIKTLARPLRQHDRLLQRLGPLESELDDLRLASPSTEIQTRIARLEAQLLGLREEVVNAFLAIGTRGAKAKR